MLKILSKTLPILLIAVTTTSFGQIVDNLKLNEQKSYKYAPNKKIVCEAGTGDMPRIPVPEAIKERIRARVKTATFEITYNTGFPAEAKAAFEFATDIWGAVFSSEVPIRVNAEYKLLENENTLGGSILSDARANFKNAPKVNSWFQMPIAEKIAGEDLNGPSEFDIDIEFNSSVDWYFDTVNPDSIVGTGKHDFATVALHELGHALGFSAFVNVSTSGIGDLASSGLPFVYVRYVDNLSGDNLHDDITNETTEMGDQLTGESLKFNGPITSVRIYAPEEFSAGSSISHTNQLPSQLMNPQLSPNGYIHSPGRALDVLKDCGWEFTAMKHEPVASTENFDQTFEINVEVQSDIGYDSSTLRLSYSIDDFESDTTTTSLMPTGEPDKFTFTIPNPGQERIFSYYLTVEDDKGRTFTNPGEAPDRAFFRFIAAVDDSIPEISHTPVDFLLPAETELPIDVSITDYWTGVDTAYVEWFINDVAQDPASMTQDKVFPAGWSGTLSFPSGLQSGDILKYRILAIDNASNPQTGFAPSETEFFSIAIESVSNAVLSYETDFNSPNDDFLGAKFTIETAAGFPDGSLNSLHPYEEAGSGGTINYVSQLKIPIIIDVDNPTMKFDEVVLVEPGLTTGFPSQDFFDYVIVEGSGNEGASWQRFLDGYDSRAKSNWLARWNAGLGDDGTSTSSGSAALYQEREIDLLENTQFEAGDTIVIRFRLFSDPFAVGWGWSIDNLKIQGEPDEVVAISDYLDSENSFNVYPNPSSSGLFNIEANFIRPIPNIQLEVMDMMGRIVKSEDFSASGQTLSYQLDLGDQPVGVYLINTIIGTDRLTTRIIKSN
jgi:hypothetical protein